MPSVQLTSIDWLPAYSKMLLLVMWWAINIDAVYYQTFKSSEVQPTGVDMCNFSLFAVCCVCAAYLLEPTGVVDMCSLFLTGSYCCWLHVHIGEYFSDFVKTCRLFIILIMLCLVKKVPPYSCLSDFAKCWLIFRILSAADLAINFWQSK